MSTKADLEKYVTKLQEQVGNLKGQVAASERLESRGQDQLAELQTQRDHYRAQRDQLVGFIQGIRRDHDSERPPTDGYAINTYSTNQPRETMIEDFLGRMERNSDGSVMF